MQRTIKFRGKRTDTKEWVYGFYNFTIYDDGSDPLMSIIRVHIIADADGYVWSIDENTVGQFTGLTDKNGKEIYEGDVVVGFARVFIATVEWNNGQCGFSPFGDERTSFVAYESLIIGNIHDNPELLGGSK